MTKNRCRNSCQNRPFRATALEKNEWPFYKEYGSLYPESFPAGELAGSCTLIENADLRQDGNIAVLTVTLADGPIHGRNFGDGYYRFTAETGYTGIADIGPYLRVTLNATNELFAGN